MTMKDTWYSYLRDEAEKKRQSQKKKEKRKNRVNTKAFRTAQSFGEVPQKSRKDE